MGKVSTIYTLKKFFELQFQVTLKGETTPLLLMRSVFLSTYERLVKTVQVALNS